MDTPQQYPTMWTTGFVGGVKVSFTFPIRNEMEAYAQAKAITDKLLADGFTTTEPGLEAGEEKEQVGWVLRREKDDGTAVLDLYIANERFSFRYVMCYLDSAEDIKAFQDATGLNLNTLPLYVGDRLERDGKEKSKKYIIPVARSATAIIKDNPDYNPEETDVKKKKPARLFIRWVTAATPPAPVASAPVSSQAVVGIPTPPPLDDEAALRLKDQKALDNELLAIYKVVYNPTHNGMGAPSWTATAHAIDKTSVPILVGERGAALIKRAGHDWPATDGSGLDVGVITEVVNGNRVIKSVLAIDGSTMYEMAEFAANANVGRNADIPAWIFDRTMLLQRLGKAMPNVVPNERAATVDKMHREGNYDAVGSLEGALMMTVERLKTHHQPKPVLDKAS